MPEKDGFEVLRELKTDYHHSDVPVIIYSAMESIESINFALELGAYDYFMKPLTIEQTSIIVPLKVKNALGNHEQRKALLRLNENIKIELLLVRVFQQNIMADFKQFSNADMYGRYLSTEEIGGGFYDCVQVDNVMWFIIADVSGHGVAAAMIASMLKVEFDNCIRKYSSPANVLKAMNNTFHKITKGNYHITAFVGMLQENNFVYANSGQPCLVVVSQNEEDAADITETSNFPLGLLPNTTYKNSSVKLNDIIVCYTKGLQDLSLATKDNYDGGKLRKYLIGSYKLAQDNPS